MGLHQLFAGYLKELQLVALWNRQRLNGLECLEVGVRLPGIGGGPLGIRWHYTPPVTPGGLGKASPISQPFGNFSSFD
jgi:hypothetical protein